MAEADPPSQNPANQEMLCQWITELGDPSTRENALLQLSNQKKDVPDMGHLLWHSFGVMAVFIQEITNIYPIIYSGTLTEDQIKRVRYVNSLLQCVASHPDTREDFRRSNIAMYLYPFLETTTSTLPYEYLRTTSLGVIGIMVKYGDPDAVSYLLSTDFAPLCFKMMESGLEAARLAALTTLQKILLTELGLDYFCRNEERLSQLTEALNDMVMALLLEPSVLILRYIIRCYLRMTDDARAFEVLRRCLPRQLWDDTFSTFTTADRSVRLWLHQLQIILDPSSYPYDEMAFMNEIPRDLPGVIDRNAFLSFAENE